MEKVIAFCAVLGVISIGLTSAQTANARQVKSTLFARNLDPNELPTGLNGTGPVRVNVTLKVKNFLQVDPKANVLKLQMLVKMRWNDRRLIYTPFPPGSAPDSVILDSSALEKIWVPSLYYVNSLSKEIDTDNQLIRLFVKTGDVEYSSLVTLTTSCPMQLTYYPHEMQTCLVKVSSYGHTKSSIVFNWSKDGAGVVAGADSSLPDYSLQEYTPGRCDAETENGAYSCVQLELDLQRLGSFYLIQVYIPLTMLIIISWLSYFLHPTKSATPRLILIIISLALAVIGTNGFNMMHAPLRNYTKAVDVWTGTSLTFIFIALIEFVVVNYLNHYPCPHANHCKKQLPKDADGVDNTEQQTPLNPEGDGKQCQDSDTASPEGGHGCGAKLDITFRILIPILYLVFVIFYLFFVFVF